MSTQTRRMEVGGYGISLMGNRAGSDLQRVEEDMDELQQVRCDSGDFIT